MTDMDVRKSPEETVLCVLGLGYVGLPLLIALSKRYKVIGYDISTTKIDDLNAGIDASRELSSQDLDSLREVPLVSQLDKGQEIDVFIVAVPTPIDKDHRPDLNPLRDVSVAIGGVLSRGNIVVYESTVYPGATEEVCLPILEKVSGLKLGDDFGIGYSPERINPADKSRGLADITKVVSGSDAGTLETLVAIYESVISAGVFVARNIRVAEAAKVIENAQRDVNIAFMNELAIIFDKIDIEITDVLEAAKTKWNFLDFYPGLVGGHCISVDPYYLTHKSQQMGYVPDMLLQARRVNEGFPEFIASKVVEELISRDTKVKGSKVAILGATFKENCPDLRNSKSFVVADCLQNLGVIVEIVDPYAETNSTREISYDLSDDNPAYNAIVCLVAHDTFLKYTPDMLLRQFIIPGGFIFDLKNMFQKNVMVIG